MDSFLHSVFIKETLSNNFQWNYKYQSFMYFSKYFGVDVSLRHLFGIFFLIASIFSLAIIKLYSLVFFFVISSIFAFLILFIFLLYFIRIDNIVFKQDNGFSDFMESIDKLFNFFFKYSFLGKYSKRIVIFAGFISQFEDEYAGVDKDGKFEFKSYVNLAPKDLVRLILIVFKDNFLKFEFSFIYFVCICLMKSITNFIFNYIYSIRCLLYYLIFVHIKHIFFPFRVFFHKHNEGY